MSPSRFGGETALGLHSAGVEGELVMEKRSGSVVGTTVHDVGVLEGFWCRRPHGEKCGGRIDSRVESAIALPSNARLVMSFLGLFSKVSALSICDECGVRAR